jgi:hypothetical protein
LRVPKQKYTELCRDIVVPVLDLRGQVNSKQDCNPNVTALSKAAENLGMQQALTPLV